MTNNNGQLNNARRGGFSLIELLVVIAVIGILAGLLVPSFSAARIQAKKVKVITLISVLDAGLQQFKSETRLGRDYPPSFWNTGTAGNPYKYLPVSNSDLLKDDKYAYGANTLVWALAGPTLQGTAGFQVDATSHPEGLADLYRPANTNRTYGPYIDVTDVDIKTAEKTSLDPTVLTEVNPAWPVIVDVFNMPILYFKANVFNVDNEPHDRQSNRPFLSKIDSRSDFLKVVKDDRQSDMFGPSGGYYKPDSFLLLSAGPDMNFGETDRNGLEGWSDNIANFPIK